MLIAIKVKNRLFNTFYLPCFTKSSLDFTIKGWNNFDKIAKLKFKMLDES